MDSTSAFAVANFIIENGHREGVPVTHLKLQKLVYFCYAWFAGNYGKELFPEDIEAWQYGPVVRELYNEFRRCGSGPITTPATSVDWGTRMFVAPQVTPELAAELKPIWDAYKNKSSAWLVEATHLDEEPWGQVVQQYGSSQKRKIPFELIRKVYADRVAKIPD